MATLYSLCCDTCKVYVDVGQTGGDDGKFRLYRPSSLFWSLGWTTSQDMVELFLLEHMGHMLRFLPDRRVFELDYEEIEDLGA